MATFTSGSGDIIFLGDMGRVLFGQPSNHCVDAPGSCFAQAGRLKSGISPESVRRSPSGSERPDVVTYRRLAIKGPNDGHGVKAKRPILVTPGLLQARGQAHQVKLLGLRNAEFGSNRV